MQPNLCMWITVQNSHRFVDELIEIGGFAKIIEE
jgi:hypothetical protein